MRSCFFICVFQVTYRQHPAVAVDSETFPNNPGSHEDSDRDEASKQVKEVMFTVLFQTIYVDLYAL